MRHSGPGSSNRVAIILDRPSFVSRVLINTLVRVSSDLSVPCAAVPHFAPELADAYTDNSAECSSCAPEDYVTNRPKFIDNPGVLGAILGPDSFLVNPACFVSI